MPIPAFGAEEIQTSDMPTSHLIALALTAPTIPGRSELFGRDRAYYSIASTPVATLEFLLDTSDDHDRRVFCARALALAGYSLATARELARG
jgi:hypothetical protein